MSHCWGALKPVQLTAGTEASLRAGIPTDCLPKSFRDAISMAIQFCVPYIWIDSMNIFQDSLDDWSREAAVMRDVYSHALCNIAATGASDGFVGLFFERDPDVHCPFWVNIDGLRPNAREFQSRSYPAGTYGLLPPDAWEDDLELSPLNRRAWVFQERLLSTRVMHFSGFQVFWECLENASSEVFPDALPPLAQPSWYKDAGWLKRVLFRDQNDDAWGKDLYRSW